MTSGATISALSKDDTNATINTNTTASSLASKYSTSLIGENDSLGGVGRTGTDSPSIGGSTNYGTTGNMNNRFRAEKKLTAKVSYVNRFVVIMICSLRYIHLITQREINMRKRTSETCNIVFFYCFNQHA